MSDNQTTIQAGNLIWTKTTLGARPKPNEACLLTGSGLVELGTWTGAEWFCAAAPEGWMPDYFVVCEVP